MMRTLYAWQMAGRKTKTKFCDNVICSF